MNYDGTCLTSDTITISSGGEWQVPSEVLALFALGGMPTLSLQTIQGSFNFWVDGTTPTISTGFQAETSGIVSVNGASNIKGLRILALNTVIISYGLFVK